MSLTILPENVFSNIDLYFLNMSIYFTPGDSVYSDPDFISYKVVNFYEPKYQAINKNSEIIKRHILSISFLKIWDEYENPEYSDYGEIEISSKMY
jgi:hypothetical protein